MLLGPVRAWCLFKNNLVSKPCFPQRKVSICKFPGTGSQALSCLEIQPLLAVHREHCGWGWRWEWGWTCPEVPWETSLVTFFRLHVPAGNTDKNGAWHIKVLQRPLIPSLTFLEQVWRIRSCLLIQFLPLPGPWLWTDGACSTAGLS